MQFFFTERERKRGVRVMWSNLKRDAYTNLGEKKKEHTLALFVGGCVALEERNCICNLSSQIIF